jgi:2'-5' RNA ligase
LEVLAPWPEDLPKGRLLDPTHRHLTIAFLGNTNFPHILDTLKDFPQPPFKVGLAGIFDKCLFLPKKHPNVAAWHVTWLCDSKPLADYQKTFLNWLTNSGFTPNQSEREWLPHATLCRKPFNTDEWTQAFVPLPMIFKDLHLYESVGDLKYTPIWTFPLLAPFEELDHTADIAFKIHGNTLHDLYCNALIALAFEFTPFKDFQNPQKTLDTIDDVIISLNDALTQIDQKIGCPFKAVSFHGDVTLLQNDILQWEMIVDV